jgi:hypothetical protein
MTIHSYLRANKIAIVFNSRFEYLAIHQVMGKDTSAWWKKGWCSFYEERHGILRHTYRCSSVDYYPPNYTILSYDEFMALTQDGVQQLGL